MDHKDVEIIGKKTLYDGFFRYSRVKFRYKLFAGGWGNTLERELFERNDAVCVLPYDPKLDKVILIEQFRVGALNKPDTPWLLETVAGFIEPGESKEQVAIREAKEEAGCQVSDLQFICDYWPSPGACDERVTLFCGTVDTSQAGGIYGLDEEDEDIKVHVFSTQDAFNLVKDNKIQNAATIISLQWLALKLKSS